MRGEKEEGFGLGALSRRARVVRGTKNGEETKARPLVAPRTCAHLHLRLLLLYLLPKPPKVPTQNPPHPRWAKGGPHTWRRIPGPADGPSAERARGEWSARARRRREPPPAWRWRSSSLQCERGAPVPGGGRGGRGCIYGGRIWGGQRGEWARACCVKCRPGVAVRLVFFFLLASDRRRRRRRPHPRTTRNPTQPAAPTKPLRP